jgi:hypothetical protein
MTDEDFDAYLESALDELEAKQSLLSDAYGLGRHERFVVDYESLTLSFSRRTPLRSCTDPSHRDACARSE